MFRWLARLFSRSIPAALGGGQWTGTAFTDSYKRSRAPSPNELLAELKGVAWACASLNASACATHAPRLYVVTQHNQPKARCATRAVPRHTLDRLAGHPAFAHR